MQDAKELLPLVSYQLQWAIIGIVLILLVALWIAYIFWTTRRRRPKTVATIKGLDVNGVDIVALRKKYLAFIEEISQECAAKTLTDRQVHQKLSILLRLFAFEASGFRAQVMTLADIRKGRFPKLGEAVETYYPNEFQAVIAGSSAEAIEKAKEVVTTWQ